MKQSGRIKLRQLILGICMAVVFVPLCLTMGGPTKGTAGKLADSIFEIRGMAASIDDQQAAEASLPRMKQIVAEMEQVNERPWKWYFAREELASEILKHDATATMAPKDFMRLEAMVAYDLQKKSARSEKEFWPVIEETVRAYEDQVRLVNQPSSAWNEVGLRLLVLLFVLQWTLNTSFSTTETKGQRHVYQAATGVLAVMMGAGIYRTYQGDWATLTMVVYASVGIAVALYVWSSIRPVAEGEKIDQTASPVPDEE